MIKIISHDCADDFISLSGAYLELNESEKIYRSVWHTHSLRTHSISAPSRLFC